MFTINRKTNRMFISRGDSGHFTVNFTGDVPSDGTKVLFTVVKQTGGIPYISKTLECASGAVEVSITSRDTNRLTPGDYYWDLRVKFSDDEVSTPMYVSLFTVLEVAGNV